MVETGLPCGLRHRCRRAAHVCRRRRPGPAIWLVGQHRLLSRRRWWLPPLYRVEFVVGAGALRACAARVGLGARAGVWAITACFLGAGSGLFLAPGQPCAWIDITAVFPYLEMQMGAGGPAAGVAHDADLFAGGDCVSGLYGAGRQMLVFGLHTVAVVEHDLVAFTSGGRGSVHGAR